MSYVCVKRWLYLHYYLLGTIGDGKGGGLGG